MSRPSPAPEVFAGALPWRPAGEGLGEGLEVRLRVTLRGGRNALEGVETLADGRAILKARVQAAPEAGAANDAVRRPLAGAFGLPVSAVVLKAGATGRVKTLVAAGDAAVLAHRLAAVLGPGSGSDRASSRGRARFG